MFHQPTLERLLREDFELGVKVDSFLGYEVVSVSSSPDQATLTARNIETGEETEFTGQYIVGSDGGAACAAAQLARSVLISTIAANGS